MISPQQNTNPESVFGAGLRENLLIKFMGCPRLLKLDHNSLVFRDCRSSCAGVNPSSILLRYYPTRRMVRVLSDKEAAIRWCLRRTVLATRRYLALRCLRCGNFEVPVPQPVSMGRGSAHADREYGVHSAPNHRHQQAEPLEDYYSARKGRCPRKVVAQEQ